MSLLVEIRPAIADDEIALFGIYEDALRGHIEKIWGWDPQWQANDFAQAFAKTRTFIVESQDELLGYYQMQEQADCEYLRMLILLPAARGKGIGAALLSRIRAEARRPLRLRVFRTNPDARRFYEREGWHVVGEDENGFFMAP